MEISYSAQVQQAIFSAMDVAKELNHASVGTEHLLIGIVKTQDARLSKLLKKKGITDQTLIRDVQVLFGFNTSFEKNTTLTGLVVKILNQAEDMADGKAEKEVSIDDLSLSLLQSENNVALELLRRSDVAIEELIEQLNQTDLFGGLNELSNLNEKALLRKGKIIAREKELLGLTMVLMRMEKSNCVLTGPAGVGKSAIVEELASRIEKGQVPDELKGCIVAQLNVNQIVSGTKYRGEFEKRIQNLINFLQKRQNVILFIDELHLIVGAGKAEGSLDIASVLKPLLARSDLKVIGATTDDEYEKWIAKDKALERRFIRIEVKEPDEAMTLSMLKEKAKDLSKYHQIKFEKGILQECISISKGLMPHLQFPDKAIDLLDMSCSCARVEQNSIVDSGTLKKAASYLSDRPFIIKRMKEFCDVLKDDFTLEQVDQMTNSLNSIINQQKNVLWKLTTDFQQSLNLQKILKEEYKASICELNASFLNELSYPDAIELIKRKLQGNQFHVLWINQANQLRDDLNEMFTMHFKEAVSLNNTLNIASGHLFVMQQKRSKEKTGFIQENSQMKFETILMDESLLSVLS